MSRFKNRNIRGKLSEISSAKWKPITTNGPQTPKENKLWEVRLKKSSLPISDIKDVDSSSSDETLCPLENNEDDDLRNHLDDSLKSGESSVSWADDYEAKATNLVQEEFERMERVLQCLEPIPANYDKDEYKLWIKTFPRLSTLKKIPKNLQIKENSSTKHQIGPKPVNCDRKIASSSSSSNNSRAKIDLDDLNQLIDNLYPSNNSQTSKTTFNNSKDLAVNNTLNPRTLDLKLETSFLQLAPLNVPLLNKKPTNSQRLSAYSRTANWLQGMRVNDNTQRNRSSSYNRTERRAHSDFIVLPPIEAKHNELRSVSAVAITNSFYRPYSKTIKINHPKPLYERKDQEESDSDPEFSQHVKRHVNFRYRKRPHLNEVT